MFDVEASDSEGVRRIVLVGEFDLAAMPAAETSLAEATANGYAAIEIDLSALTFLDSSGVRSLMITVDRCRERGTPLTIIPGPRGVQRVFEITGLVDALPFSTPSDPADDDRT
jgi:anti-anti-sigma factor